MIKRIGWMAVSPSWSGWMMAWALAAGANGCDAGGDEPSATRPSDEVQQLLRQLEETDPASRMPATVDFDKTVVGPSVRTDPSATDRAIAELAAGAVDDALSKELIEAVPAVASALAQSKRAAAAPAAAAKPVAPARPATPADGCRALYGACDGVSYRTDVCVRDLPACEAGAPAGACCPTDCVESYRALRRGGMGVADAGQAVFGPAGHECLLTLTQPPSDGGLGGGNAPATPDAPAMPRGAIPPQTPEASSPSPASPSGAPLVFPPNP